MSDTQRTLTANFTADTSGFSPKINELIQKLKTLNQDFEQNKSKVSELNAKIKAYQQELNKLNSTTNNGATASREQQQRMQQLRDSIAACNTQIGTYRAAQTNLRSQINSTNRELTEQQQAFNGVNTAAASFGDILKANLASSAIQAGLQKSLNLLRQSAAYCYQVGSSFEAGMSQVAAVSGASADDLERLTAKAKELGSSTKFTASETAQAMNYMAMAGWKTEEMLDGIGGVLDLAAASGTDLATTSDIVTDALTAFGLEAEDCAHFADVLAAASANANTNVALMGETFKYCAADAGSFKFSAEDTVAAIGLMASAGIKGSQAGTATRRFLSKLSDDLTIVSKNFGEITIKTAEADGKMRPLLDIVKDLRTAFAEMNDQERAAVAEDLVGTYAKTGFLTMMNASEKSLEKLTYAIDNCDGAAKNMAQTMGDNVQGAVTKFNSALEGVGIAVYDKFKDGLTDAVNIFTEAMSGLTDDIEGGGLDETMESLADSFKSVAKEVAVIVRDELPGFIDWVAKGITFVIDFRKEIVSAVAGFAAFKGAMSIGNLITELVRSFKSLTTALKGAQAAQTGLNAAQAASPVGAVAAGVGLIVGVVTDIALRTKDAAQSVDELREKSQELAQATDEYKRQASDLRDIKNQYEEIYNAVDPNVDKTQTLKDLQDKLIAQFPELAGKIDLASGSYDDLCAKLQNVIDKTSEAYKTSAEGSIRALKKQERDIATELDAPGAHDFFNEFWTDTNRYMAEELKTYRLVNGKVTFEGSYEDRLADMKSLYEWLNQWGYGDYNPAENSDFAISIAQKMGEVQKLKEELEAAQAEYDKAVNGSGSKSDITPGAAYGPTLAIGPVKTFSTSARALTDEERREEYKKEKQLADDMYSVGEISAEEYYKKLVELRDKYLDKGTHDWYQATSQILSAYDKTAEGIAKASARSANNVKNSLDEVSMAYKKTLAAIDAEIERHNRQKSDDAFQKKIDEIDGQLAYGRLDDFSKYELEKERQKLIEEHNEELYSRSAADAKSIVQDAYNAKTTLDKAGRGTREYTLAVGDYTDALGDLTEVMRGVGMALGVQNGGNSSVNNIDESTKNNYVNVILQAVNKSNSQLVDELIRALHSGL